MRHVSRTRRVALDWSFDRINLDPQLRIKYVETSFTRDDWNHLLRLLSIMNISMFSCSHSSPVNDPQTMSKRLIHEGKPGGEERAVAKQKPIWTFVSKTVDRSPLTLSSSASHSRGTLRAHSLNLDLTGTGKLAARGWNENTASSSQVWHSDVNPNTSTGKPVAKTTKNPINTKVSHHDLRISRNNVGHLEKVHSNVRQKLGRQPGDDMPEIDVNMLIWLTLMSATMKAAVHSGQY